MDKREEKTQNHVNQAVVVSGLSIYIVYIKKRVYKNTMQTMLTTSFAHKNDKIYPGSANFSHLICSDFNSFSIYKTFILDNE